MENTKLGRTDRRTWLVGIGAAIGLWPMMAAVRSYLTAPAEVHGSTAMVENIDAVLPDGARTELVLHGRPVFVARRGNEVAALDLTCTHASCPLHVDVGAARIRCGCHGGAFDLNGQPVQAPPTVPLRRYRAHIENGTLYVHLPPPERT